MEEWLLDADPAIRWQVVRDVIDAPADEIAGERARVAVEGWGAAVLALQDPDGTWDGGAYRPGWVDEDRPFFDAWTATHFALQQLREFGLDPGSPRRGGPLPVCATTSGGRRTVPAPSSGGVWIPGWPDPELARAGRTDTVAEGTRD